MQNELERTFLRSALLLHRTDLQIRLMSAKYKALTNSGLRPRRIDKLTHRQLHFVEKRAYGEYQEARAFLRRLRRSAARKARRNVLHEMLPVVYISGERVMPSNIYL